MSRTPTTTPRFSRKESRDLAEEAQAAGFFYVDDDTKGHARFLYAARCADHDRASCEHARCIVSLAETPGHGQIKRIRDTIARVTGARRGSFDRAAQRDRQTRDRESKKAARAAALAREQASADARAEQIQHRRLDRVARDLANGTIPKSHGRRIAATLSLEDQRYLARAYATALEAWGWRWRRHPDNGAAAAWCNAARAAAS